jgi:hypothetical protein
MEHADLPGETTIAVKMHRISHVYKGRSFLPARRLHCKLWGGRLSGVLGPKGGRAGLRHGQRGSPFRGGDRSDGPPGHLLRGGGARLRRVNNEQRVLGGDTRLISFLRDCYLVIPADNSQEEAMSNVFVMRKHSSFRSYLLLGDTLQTLPRGEDCDRSDKCSGHAVWGVGTRSWR